MRTPNLLTINLLHIDNNTKFNQPSRCYYNQEFKFITVYK